MVDIEMNLQPNLPFQTNINVWSREIIRLNYMIENIKANFRNEINEIKLENKKNQRRKCETEKRKRKINI